MADLLIRNARLVATVDAARRELPGGWVADRLLGSQRAVLVVQPLRANSARPTNALAYTLSSSIARHNG